jgi:hypothetical protein
MSRCRHRCIHRAAATALPPSRCALPPQRRRQAAANDTLSRCRHRRAAAKLPPTLSRCCHPRSCRAAAAALPPPPRRRQAAADLALSRCRHRRCRRRHATVRWLVVVLLSTVVIACRHATINALVAGRFHQ